VLGGCCVVDHTPSHRPLRNADSEAVRVFLSGP